MEDANQGGREGLPLFPSSGYNNRSGNYGDANNLNALPQAMYNNNSSAYFPWGYGFRFQMAYGQFPPCACPWSHQMPVTQPYYHPISHGQFPPHTRPLSHQMPMNWPYYCPVSPGEFPPRAGPWSHQMPVTRPYYGPVSPGQFSPHARPQSHQMPVTRPYYPPVSRGPQHVTSALPSSQTESFPSGSSGRENLIDNAYFGRGTGYHLPFVSFGRGNHSASSGLGLQSRSGSLDTTDSNRVSNHRNKGPRASKREGKSSPEKGSASGDKGVKSTSGLHIDYLNSPNFMTDYERAKFFVMKSSNEENIRKSIKYSAWTTTEYGNLKLDAAYHEAKETEGICPVFLFFSVNAGGQFCGVAEMVGPVDFGKNANYWIEDRWRGQFPVKWHIIKDVPNSHLGHIILENNENKPVTDSRNAHEVKLEQGIEMLKIFKSYDAKTSLLDDFDFFDEREKIRIESKAKQQSSTSGNTIARPATDPIKQLADNLADTLFGQG